jgi:hypothetical protein
LPFLKKAFSLSAKPRGGGGKWAVEEWKRASRQRREMPRDERMVDGRWTTNEAKAKRPALYGLDAPVALLG